MSELSKWLKPRETKPVAVVEPVVNVVEVKPVKIPTTNIKAKGGCSKCGKRKVSPVVVPEPGETLSNLDGIGEGRTLPGTGPGPSVQGTAHP